MTGLDEALLSWVVVTASQQGQANTGYIVDRSSEITITLPASPAVGDVVRVAGLGSGGWKVAQNEGQVVLVGPVPMLGWVPRESSRGWRNVASSSDGSKLVAVVWGGQIYSSTDSGETWTARESGRYWKAVASSSDGNKLVAVVTEGQIYTSTDSGETWTARENSRSWASVASSSDGSKLVAVVNGGRIYTYSGMTTPGTGGFLTGDAGAAVELLCVGGGRFRIVGYVGNLKTE